MRRPGGHGHRRAFTMVELLVVVAIATIMLLIAVPAFKSLAYSTRRASAENSLKGGLRTARMVAIEAGEGRDVAAVFTHDPGGRVTIVPAVIVGEILDQINGELRRVELFAPVSGVDAVQLPPGWSVRAYAPPNSIAGANESTGWYSSGNYPAAQGNWVFPETGFYDISRADDGDHRQTFMVRFHGGSGELDLSHSEPVLVLDVAPTNAFRLQPPWSKHRADTAIDLVRFVRRVLEADFPDGTSPVDRRRLLGNEATDTVLARAVGQLAVYNERRLAAGVGARRLNRDTGTLYMGLGDPNNPNKEPRLDLSLFPAGATPQSVSEAVSDWLESQAVSSDAMVFTIQRYSGRAQEMLPLEPQSGGQP